MTLSTTQVHELCKEVGVKYYRANGVVSESFYLTHQRSRNEEEIEYDLKRNLAQQLISKFAAEVMNVADWHIYRDMMGASYNVQIFLMSYEQCAALIRHAYDKGRLEARSATAEFKA